MKRTIHTRSSTGEGAPTSQRESLVRVVREVDGAGASTQGVTLLLSVLGFTPWHGALARWRR
jgi:hypothetical protein